MFSKSVKGLSHKQVYDYQIIFVLLIIEIVRICDTNSQWQLSPTLSENNQLLAIKVNILQYLTINHRHAVLLKSKQRKECATKNFVI